MKIQHGISRQRQGGYVLTLTLVFISVSLILLASICKWTSTESSLTARNNAYNNCVAAAEAATEVTIAEMDRDFLHQALSADVNTYNDALPGDYIAKGWPADYKFVDAKGNANKSDIVCKGWQAWTNVNTEYGGLFGLVNSYEITATAKRITGPYAVAAAVRQDVTFTSIPIFQYAIFYSMDLEISPSPPMIVSGKTHGNANMYLAPTSTLEFQDAVTLVGNVFYHRNPDDPTNPDNKGVTVPIFDNGKPKQVGSMSLPIGLDNSPTNVIKILDAPPTGEDPASQLGSQRFYNRSDLVITITNDSVTLKYNNNEDGTNLKPILADSGTNNSGKGSGNTSGYSFINTNASFYDYREGKPVIATEIDVKALTNWLATTGFTLNVVAQAQNSHGINSIYVNDQRTTSGKLTAVRVSNGQYLPPAGLTIATPQPLYVRGNFNAPDLTPGTTNTANTKPAALVSDAITILSTNWNDSWNASTKLASRNAVNTTVNAAILSGIVPTVENHFSGGVENLPRFLEGWGSSTLTYNGSMVVMFSSRNATNYWVGPGTYYNPPTRKWAFDKNFLDANKMPPNTPQVRKLDRGQWSVVATTK